MILNILTIIIRIIQKKIGIRYQRNNASNLECQVVKHVIEAVFIDALHDNINSFESNLEE